MKTRMTVGVAGLLGLIVTMSVHTAAQEVTPAQIMARSQEAFLAAGNDMVARITMTLINKAGKERLRELTMLRKDLENGNQRYFMYFHQPADVRAMTFMVWKYPGRDDDRWLFVPAIKLVRRIAADDNRSSFVGSDFTYEDVSGRDVNDDTHSLLREEKLADRNCYVIQSVPKAAADYAKRVSWIDKENSLPLKEEYQDAQGALFRVFTADKVENITVGEGDKRQVLPTATQRTMKNVKSGHRTEVKLSSVTYNVGLKDEDFSERRMRRPPPEWTR